MMKLPLWFACVFFVLAAAFAQVDHRFHQTLTPAPVADLSPEKNAADSVAGNADDGKTAEAPARKGLARTDLTLEELEAIAVEPAKHHEATGSRVVPEMIPLFLDKKITYTGGTKYKNATIKYRLHTPKNMEPDKKYPLILWLHGVGECGNDNLAQLIHLHHVITYLTGPKQQDFFLLVPQAPSNHSAWEPHRSISYISEAVPANSEEIGRSIGRMIGGRSATVREVVTGEALEDSPLGFSFAMVDAVMKEYPVDPDRVTVSGLS
ncbi:MAG TPA: hypothetical protein DEB39_11525, partial [Planctomycetaceae bacterium]|nr:hypothetical protein [Planctomycetaceae bacterium]